MFVYLSARSCNCCGKSVDTGIVDIPFEEIKLAPFAVKCDCGYFYEAYHYTVSFDKWRVAKRKLEYQLENAESDSKREQEYCDTVAVLSPRLVENLKQKRDLVVKLQFELNELSDKPVPNHLWIE